jgi:hypothetical protein
MSEFTGIIIWGWIHPKNKIGIGLIAAHLNCPVTFLDSSIPVSVVNTSDGNFVIVSDKFFPRERITKPFVLYGPHINSPICLGHLGEFANSKRDQIFNCLSQWNVTVQKIFNPPCKLVAVPFPVEISKFTPGVLPRTKTFIYIKFRQANIVNAIKSIFTPDYTFVYGSYKEDEYLQALKQSKFGVWVGCHESQGFALQEALACDVPLIVLDVDSMGQQTGCRIHVSDAGCGVTSTPYWDDRCGVKITSESGLQVALEKINEWKHHPRDFVTQNLSAEVCAKKFQALF